MAAFAHEPIGDPEDEQNDEHQHDKFTREEDDQFAGHRCTEPLIERQLPARATFRRAALGRAPVSSSAAAMRTTASLIRSQL